MSRLVTKRNIAILNIVLLGVFVVTLIAVAVPFVKDEAALPSPHTREALSTLTARLNREETSSVTEREQRLARIVEGALFGFDAEDPPPPFTPPPPLRLKLAGVSSIGGQWVAILRDESKKKEYMVRVGDEVGDYFGVRATSITVDQPSVTYRRPGVGEVTLTMGTATGPAAGSDKDEWSTVIRAVRPGHTYVVKVPLLMERVGSADSFLGTFGFEATMEGTRANGLKITSLEKDDFLYAAGLRQGDVIKTINDSPITEVASVLEHLAKPSNEFTCRVGIVRGRTSRIMYYTLLKE